jgi:hypothetical protein
MIFQQHIDLLNKIRDRLVYTGWRRGYSNNFDKPSCILDTIDAVNQFINKDHIPRIRDILNNIEDQFRFLIAAEDPTGKYSVIPGKPETGISIVDWNDDKNRKFKDILNLVDTAISLYTSEQLAGV